MASSPAASEKGTTSAKVALGFFLASGKRLALQFVLTKALGWVLSHYTLHAEEHVQDRYREVYADDSAVRQWAVVVFVFNITQNLASQMLTGCVDEESRRDLAGTSCSVNVVALFMYSFYSAHGAVVGYLFFPPRGICSKTGV